MSDKEKKDKVKEDKHEKSNKDTMMDAYDPRARKPNSPPPDNDYRGDKDFTLDDKESSKARLSRLDEEE